MNDDLTLARVAVEDVTEVADLAGVDLDTVAVRWLALRDIHRQLGVLVDDYALWLGKQLATIDYVKKDGFPLSTGATIYHQSGSTEHWDGRRLLAALSTDMIEPATGEVTAAIPIRVLADILPGIDGTSSRWRTTGLKNVDVDPDDFRSREWKAPKAMEGKDR